MSTPPQDFQAVWREDGSATVLGRHTLRNGSGAATGVSGEGNFTQQDDLSTITCAVFDEDSDTPDTAIATPTVTIADAILDTPVTSAVLWTKDATGYNFLHDLPASAFPTGGHRYRVEYKFTDTGGGVSWGIFVGRAAAVRTS